MCKTDEKTFYPIITYGILRFRQLRGGLFGPDPENKVNVNIILKYVKSVQSALSDLLTTPATHGTFSRPSTKRGLILIGLELNTNARESLNIADHIH